MIAQSEPPDLAALQHVLCGLILLGRIGDVVSTWLITPKLSLEANPLVRKLGWKFALVTLLICFVPYLDWRAGLMVVPPFLMISGSNISKIWVVRAQGEKQVLARTLEVARQSSFGAAALSALGSAGFFFFTGLVLVLLTVWESKVLGYRPDDDFPSTVGELFGYGIMAYGVAIGFHGTLYLRRIFRMAAQGEAQAGPGG